MSTISFGLLSWFVRGFYKSKVFFPTFGEVSSLSGSSSSVEYRGRSRGWLSVPESTERIETLEIIVYRVHSEVLGTDTSGDTLEGKNGDFPFQGLSS